MTCYIQTIVKYIFDVILIVQDYTSSMFYIKRIFFMLYLCC